MEELVVFVNEAFDTKRLHPLLVVGIFTIVFLEIHPFQDGNGRLSRILTTLLLLRAGYAYVPYISLESVIEQSKEGYYLALRQTQGTIRTDAPNWQPWIIFFLRALQQQTIIGGQSNFNLFSATPQGGPVSSPLPSCRLTSRFLL
jgi:Fic family protein